MAGWPRQIPDEQPAERSSDARALALLQRLANCRDVAAMLLALAEALPALLPHSDRVSLALLEPDGANLRVYRLLPPLLPQPEQLPRVRVAGTVVGQVATDGKPRAVADVRDDDQLRFGRASHDGIRSTASVPVRVAGRLVGALNAGVKKVGGCRASDLEELAVLAAVIGPALWLAERGDHLTAPGQQVAPVPSIAAGDSLYSEATTKSPAMRELLALARRAAASDATVLLTGETGAGKTLLARQIHAWSPRRTAPFLSVHIGDLSGNLVESELFGHERGAFTGATQRRVGRFEQANGGTLFLDEIGEAPLAVQAKLLRVTQEGCLERVGGTATVRTDVRIVAATHRDLTDAVARGEFRRDLLYRLDIVSLRVPPLRQRPEDLEGLALAILAGIARKQRRTLRLSATAWLRLRAHDWPGNVRELESVLLRAALLEPAETLDLAGLLVALPAPRAPEPAADWPTRDEQERRYLLRVLGHTGGRIEGRDGAAKLLGMAPSTLRSRAQRLGLDLQTARPAGKE